MNRGVARPRGSRRAGGCRALRRGDAPRPVATAEPSVSGTAAVGRRLTALTGTWTGAGATEVRFQWYRCDASGARCNPVHGATSATYTLVPRDVAKTIGADRLGHRRDGGTSTAYASLVGPIARPTPLLVATVQPLVAGFAVQGKAVQASTGVWSPTPAKVTYAWLRCNATDASAAASPTRPAARTRSASPTSATRSSRSSRPPSARRRRAPSAPRAGGGRRHRGRPVARLRAERERHRRAEKAAHRFARHWSGLGTVTFAYQWYRCDVPARRPPSIRGATRQTYPLGARDIGKTLGLTLRATDTSGTATAYASLVGPIAPTPSVLLATEQPTIRGDPRRGQRCRSPGTWSPTPASSPTPGSAATRTAASAPRSMARPPPPTS